MSAYVTRFAPSPTGRLHLGHAFSALSAFEAARRADGRFILRIEDIDTTRCRPIYEAALLEDLAWLGLSWEQPVRRQSDHLADYRSALALLEARGLTYRCFRTRGDLDIARAPHGPGEGFVGEPLEPEDEAARLALGKPFAVRLSLRAAANRLGGFSGLGFVEHGRGPQGETGDITVDPASTGDVVLARKDIGVAYHLAVVVDDALQGVTEVVRGEDLFEATSVQRVLQALLGLPAPTYRHHPLLADASGRRLAKRDGAKSLAALRAEGIDPRALRSDLGFA